MENKKIHLAGFGRESLCGIKSFFRGENAKSYKEVSCKRCIKSIEYKRYLKGMYREKPDV